MHKFMKHKRQNMRHIVKTSDIQSHQAGEKRHLDKKNKRIHDNWSPAWAPFSSIDQIQYLHGLVIISIIKCEMNLSIWEWISKFILQFTWHAITYPGQDLS